MTRRQIISDGWPYGNNEVGYTTFAFSHFIGIFRKYAWRLGRNETAFEG